MFVAPLAAVTLLITAATGPIVEPDAAVSISTHQKNAALQQLMHSATECIARTVAADPRAGNVADKGNLGDLIVESMPACVGPVRAMIDRYDAYFGDGAGEAFFMGPYLDVLPAAVNQWVVRRSGSSLAPK